MLIIAGLGNPGREYAKNRHNVGYMAADAIAAAQDFPPFRKKFQGEASEGTIAGERVLLLKPTTYMNESGRSVGEALRFHKLAIEDVIVIHDELDLAPGKVKVKRGGGNAGHNGLRSISGLVGNDYRRVRVGIGHPGNKSLVLDSVLGDFAKDDWLWVKPLCERIAKHVELLVKGDDAGFLNKIYSEGSGQ
jgi:peptidyl-tRNA hydrolase, PTH1 family